MYHTLSPSSPHLSNESTAATHFVLTIVSLSILLATLPWLTRWLRPSRPSLEKNTTYESGIAPTGDAQTPINSRLYGIGCMALLFELEALLLFPWAILWKDTSLAAQNLSHKLYMPLVGTTVVLLWTLGLIYLLKQKPYQWIVATKIVHQPTNPGPVPHHYYEKINIHYATHKQTPPHP